MKKILIASIIVLSLSACESKVEARDGVTAVIQSVPELKGCKIFKVVDKYGTINIARCPASESVSTSTVGKHPVYTSTVMDSNTSSPELEELTRQLKEEQIKLDELRAKIESRKGN